MATGQEVDVGIQSLRDDAKTWDLQSGYLNQVFDLASSLWMTNLEGGLFIGYVSSYQEVVQQVIGRASEGGPAMHAVSTTLSGVANDYQKDEDANTHMLKSFKNLY